MTGNQKRKRTITSLRWECCFPQPADQVDQNVDKLWKSAFGGRTPFGDLRNMFRRHHCRTLNPYGGDTCPYARDQCALAFEDAVRVTCDAQPKVPVGYFIRVAKTIAAVRADAKPLTRDRGRMDVQPRTGAAEILETDADSRRSAESGLAEGSGEVRSPRGGPVAIGDLFRSLGIQPPQGRRQADAGEEGTER